MDKVSVGGSNFSLDRIGLGKDLVWRASRGVYAVDEQVIVDLLRKDGLLENLS